MGVDPVGRTRDHDLLNDLSSHGRQATLTDPGYGASGHFCPLSHKEPPHPDRFGCVIYICGGIRRYVFS